MTVKEAIDILERSCGFHYNPTDKCYGCLFENSSWCGDDFHESLLAMLKEQEAKEQISDAIHETAKQFRQTIVRCKDCIFGEQINDRYICTNAGHCQSKSNEPDWFCADGEHKEGW